MSPHRAARVVLPLYLLGIYATLSVARTVTEAVRSAGLLRLTVGSLFALVTVGVVAWLRTLPAARSWRLWLAVAVAASGYAAVILPMDSPEEKLHFVQYGLVAVLAELALPQRWRGWARALGAVLLTAAAGWVDEGIQYLLPNRYYDLRDVGFNALAGLFAVVLLWTLRWLSRTALAAEQHR